MSKPAGPHGNVWFCYTAILSAVTATSRNQASAISQLLKALSVRPLPS